MTRILKAVKQLNELINVEKPDDQIWVNYASDENGITQVEFFRATVHHRYPHKTSFWIHRPGESPVARDPYDLVFIFTEDITQLAT